MPADDIGVFDIPEKIHHERVLCRDLADFLGCSIRAVNKWAKERQCLHYFRWPTAGAWHAYVSPFTAARIIVYIRAKQAPKKKRRSPKPSP